MNVVKEHGVPIGALGVITIDNPMAAATGHRICNDCMKACIFQKQEPVDIPQIETRTLKDVLELPFGFEIYALLTRWNGQLYTVLGDEADDGRWQLRLWWKPFVTLIWGGGALIGLGGLLALLGRVAADMRRISARGKIAYRRERQGRAA
jgi:hypothetical protein